VKKQENLLPKKPEPVKLKNKHISYSELKNWATCPFYHKLVHIDGMKMFQGNEHTAFGTAMHDTCEQILLRSGTRKEFDAELFFKEAFVKQSKAIDINNKKLLQNMYTEGPQLIEHIMPALEDYFGPYEVIATEDKLYEDIEGEGYKFKGFIDLILKTEDGKYHIIDWKTCSWGWDSRRKAERMTVYQLVLYKHFWALKQEIDPSLIETHFALLKRTAKSNKVEVFKSTSGAKRIENCVNLLMKAIYNIKSKNFVKNKMACIGKWGPCEFYKTEHCT